MQARLFVTWIVVSLAAAGAVATGGPPPVPWMLAATALFGAITTAGARSALLLAGARRGAAKIEAGARAHRLWSGGALGLLVGAAGGALLAALSTWLALPSTWLGWSALLGATSVLGFAAGSVLAARALLRPRAPRSTTLAAWIVLDTALPVGVLAALAGVAIARLRFHGLEQVSGAFASRHVAVTLLLYGALLGVGGGLKTAREKLAGLVDAPAPTVEPPGAIVTGAALGLVVLVVGPRALDTVDVDTLVWTKAALGLVIGTALCALGALRGARR